MKIVVCIKQVPDTTEPLDPKTNTLIREGVPTSSTMTTRPVWRRCAAAA